jgi:hypothetical protein
MQRADPAAIEAEIERIRSLGTMSCANSGG